MFAIHQPDSRPFRLAYYRKHKDTVSNPGLVKPCTWYSGLCYDHQFINNRMLAFENPVWREKPRLTSAAVRVVSLSKPSCSSGRAFFLLLDQEQDNRSLYSQEGDTQIMTRSFTWSYMSTDVGPFITSHYNSSTIHCCRIILRVFCRSIISIYFPKVFVNWRNRWILDLRQAKNNLPFLFCT